MFRQWSTADWIHGSKVEEVEGPSCTQPGHRVIRQGGEAPHARESSGTRYSALPTNEIRSGWITLRRRAYAKACSWLPWPITSGNWVNLRRFLERTKTGKDARKRASTLDWYYLSDVIRTTCEKTVANSVGDRVCHERITMRRKYLSLLYHLIYIILY